MSHWKDMREAHSGSSTDKLKKKQNYDINWNEAASKALDVLIAINNKDQKALNTHFEELKALLYGKVS